MAVKVDTSGWKKKQFKIKKDVAEILSDRDTMEKLAETVVTDIKYQTRRGKSVVTDGPFADLSDGWIAQRKNITNSKHQAHAPSRSNLTVTGQLLDALTWTLLAPGKIRLWFDGMHQGYDIKGKTKNYTTGSISNDLLAEYVQDQGREFMGVRESLIPRLKKILTAAIRRAASSFRK